MVYTEQQKKEYQKMRRDRKAEQDRVAAYLETGKNIANDPNKHEGRHNTGGKVFAKNRTQPRWASVANSGYKI